MAAATGACEFTLRHYEEILTAARASGYGILPMRDFAARDVPAAALVLRHDIDFSVADALRMAELEAGLGIRATYAVLLHSPTYSVGEEPTLRSVQAIARLGHEIALHYDARFFEGAGLALEDGVAGEVALLSALVGSEVTTVVQHRPAAHGRRPLAQSPYLDAYGPALLDRAEYLSDSRRTWRRGCVHGWLGSGRPLYVLVHPEWWEAGKARPRNDTIERLVRARHAEIADLMSEYGKEMDANDR